MKKKILGVCIATLLILLIAPVSGSEHAENPLVLVRITSPINSKTLPIETEIVSQKTGEHTDVIIPHSLLPTFDDLHLSYTILIHDVEAYEAGVRGNYHTLAQMEAILQTIATNYPTITDLYSIGTTCQGRTIWCLEITDNPGVDEGEPGVFYMGLHHAREWPTVEICLYIANQLTSQYGSNPDITDVVNNRRLFLVTCVNPDGYYYSHDQGHDWRKNRRYFPEFGTHGVDLNRNYGGSSNGDISGAWGSIEQGSVTHYPSNEVYCGPGEFSENETQAIQNIFLNNDICATISWHTYQETVMWPWGYTPAATPDSTYMTQVGQQIAQRITKQSGSGTYVPYQSCGLYPTTGDTTDWAYGYSHYVLGKPLFAYTIEACSTFQPSQSYLDQICMENFDGALYLLQEAANIKTTVNPRVAPPIINDMSTDDDGNYQVSWVEKNPGAEPDYFQLDELTDLTTTTDDAEAGTDLWDLDGFALSTTRSYSSTHSFKSRSQNADTSAMTSNVPLPVSSGMQLSFWCWYQAELNYDGAMVEVSRDGRYYDVLDFFTGSSGAWVYKEYPLDDYVDESVYIRFRYATDSNTLQEGFYVDDISPVPSFGSVTTLSDTITSTSFSITNKPLGTYYYRVRGHNTAWGWGDFSTLESITVTSNVNDPPNSPAIDGPASGKAGTSYEYTVSAVDPDEDDVFFYIEWGDETNSGWLGPYGSGEDVVVSHSWTVKDTYTIRVKAKDVYDVESDWTELEVSMPKNTIHRPILEWLFTRFPNMFPLLRILFET